ncbi:MAG: hypothetical protein PF447_04985 [Spirochaetaceae bacterium]|jgi:hypothetical protein|nr:hypothetical protein [Spirochaetaceae bacterium]
MQDNICENPCLFSYILTGLEDHRSFGNAANTVKPLFDTKDEAHAQVKKLEKVLEVMVAEDEDVKILKTEYVIFPV